MHTHTYIYTSRNCIDENDKVKFYTITATFTSKSTYKEKAQHSKRDKITIKFTADLK